MRVQLWKSRLSLDDSATITPTLPVRARRRPALLGIAALGILPALLLAAFGLYALRREQVLILHDAGESAQQQAARLGAALQSALLDLTLPSRADVDAFGSRPAGPDQEPLSRIEHLLGDSPAVLRYQGGGTYPDLEPAATLPVPLDVDSLPPAVAMAWRSIGVRQAEPAVQASEVRACADLLESSRGTDGEAPAGFLLARALLHEGQTRDARPLLEAVALGSRPVAGETGLPLDVLALRALLQLADADRRFLPARAAWLDAYCQRVLLQWRLPDTLLEEWLSVDSVRIQEWKNVSRLHRRAREALGPIVRPANPPRDPGPSIRWTGAGDETARLLTVHQVAGGTWFIMRSFTAIRQIVNEGIRSEGLPDYLDASVTIAGRSVTSPAPGARELARTILPANDGPFLAVGLELSHPDRLDARHRVRLGLSAVLIALAAGMAIAGFLLALQAYHRERRYAELQTDFVASVSHELRAPLAAVRLMAEELTDLPPEDTGRLAQYHRLILRETRRLGLLIENVLRHARLERASRSLDLTSVDLAEVARAASESLQPSAAEYGLRIESRLPAQPMLAEADPQALQQVLVNLLDNALKHSPPGDVVEIGLDEAIPDLSNGSSRRIARLWVADRGPGIPGSEHGRIFESFYRRGSELRRETPGVGLGLAIVKRLVEAHGGSVRVSSGPGAGSRFTIELPLPHGSTTP